MISIKEGVSMLYTDNRQNVIEVTDELINIINEVCDVALKDEEVVIPYQISLLFVDNNEIRQINNETRGIDKATDVLSFPMLEIWFLRMFIKIRSLMRYI